MKIYIIIFLVLAVSACQDTSKTLNDVPELTIDSALALNSESGKLVTGLYYISKNPTQFERKLDRKDETYFINPEPIATRSDFQKIQLFTTDLYVTDGDHPGLTIFLDEDATIRWIEATGKSINWKLGFVLNDVLIYSPLIVEQVRYGRITILRVDYGMKDIVRIEKELRN